MTSGARENLTQAPKFCLEAPATWERWAKVVPCLAREKPGCPRPFIRAPLSVPSPERWIYWTDQRLILDNFGEYGPLEYSHRARLWGLAGGRLGHFLVTASKALI